MGSLARRPSPSAFEYSGAGTALANGLHFSPRRIRLINRGENWEQLQAESPPDGTENSGISERSRQVGRKPFTGCVEFNPVLNFSEGCIGHGDNQAFSLWNNSHYRLVHCLLYQIKAFGLVWADNYALISAPLILEMVFLLFLSSLCPRVKLSCDFVGFWWHSLAVSANGRAVWRITFYLKSGIELQSAEALVHTEGFFLTLNSAASKDDCKPQEW